MLRHKRSAAKKEQEDENCSHQTLDSKLFTTLTLLVMTLLSLTLSITAQLFFTAQPVFPNITNTHQQTGKGTNTHNAFHSVCLASLKAEDHAIAGKGKGKSSKLNPFQY